MLLFLSLFSSSYNLPNPSREVFLSLEEDDITAWFKAVRSAVTYSQHLLLYATIIIHVCISLNIPYVFISLSVHNVCFLI